MVAAAASPTMRPVWSRGELATTHSSRTGLVRNAYGAAVRGKKGVDETLQRRVEDAPIEERTSALIEDAQLSGNIRGAREVSEMETPTSEMEERQE